MIRSLPTAVLILLSAAAALPGAELRARVVSSTGEAIAGARVAVHPPGTGVRATIDATGSFLLRLPDPVAEGLHLAVSAPGFEDLTVAVDHAVEIVFGHA